VAKPTPQPGLVSRIRALIDDSLPMPVDQRTQRDEEGMSEPELTDRRRRRLRIRLYEKEGKGGFR
jgi:hypothetical protein